MALAAMRYAAMGWPVTPGASLPQRAQRERACSCDRVGCPAPGAHPLSQTWQLQATSDPEQVAKIWKATPGANVILVTGRVFDVLDVPAQVGTAALARMERARLRPGPVAISAGNRVLFFVLTRGAPADEDEWWSCGLDASPDPSMQAEAVRWHCRDSYVLAPPSRFGRDQDVRWVRAPSSRSLPDGLRLLEYLVDACEEEG